MLSSALVHPLRHAEQELKERLAKDWAEWNALDEESQEFVLSCLKK